MKLTPNLYLFIALALTPTLVFSIGNTGAVASKTSGDTPVMELEEGCPICDQIPQRPNILETLTCCKQKMCSLCISKIGTRYDQADPLHREYIHCPFCRKEIPFSEKRDAIANRIHSLEKEVHEQLKQGKNLFSENKKQEAKPYLESVAKQKIDVSAQAMAHVLLGFILFGEGKYEEAKAYLKPAAEQTENLLAQAMAQERLGIILSKEGKFNDAKTYLKPATKQTIDLQVQERATKLMNKIIHEEERLSQKTASTGITSR